MRTQFFIAILLLNTYTSYPIPSSTIDNITDYCNCTNYCAIYQSSSTTFYATSSLTSSTTESPSTPIPITSLSFIVNCKFNSTFLADYNDLNSNASQSFIAEYKNLVNIFIFEYMI